ncbi:hypothetical protein [Streptomyces sp. 3213.3]|uniref:hypothetical protein n=1 Tax=Streptomyces sp. 3213.3 TaxID=1855348 RepID=UPI0010422BC5|nr:hypothetical protein [Streptomyces sp. 3213.3]
MTTAQRANLLSSLNVLDSSGQLLTDTYGPLHQVTLEHALAASGTSAARAAGSVTGSTVAGYATDADTRTTKTTYDWTLGQETKATVDPAGLAIATATGYNAAGKVISNSQPSSTGSDAGTTTTTYYTATGSSPCGGHPEWADLVCQTTPAGAITGAGSNPSQRATTTTTYNLYGLPSTVTQTANGVTRSTTVTYDAAGRKNTLAVSGGVGRAVQTTTTTYNTSNGLQAKVATPDGASTTVSYDQLGRAMSSTDADANTSTVQYDALDRPTQTSFVTFVGAAAGAVCAVIGAILAMSAYALSHIDDAGHNRGIYIEMWFYHFQWWWFGWHYRWVPSGGYVWHQ